MQLFRGPKVAFVHVPKTCGKSLRNFLSESVGGADEFWDLWPAEPGSPEAELYDVVDRSHYTAEMIMGLYPDLWEEMRGMRIFSVARDPYGRSISAYGQFCLMFGDDGSAGHVRTFMDYLACVRDELYRTERNGHLYIHGAPQVKFHLPGHTLIHGEDLSSQLSDLFGRELVFKSSERHIRDLSRSERRMVGRVYADDFEMWERVRVTSA